MSSPQPSLGSLKETMELIEERIPYGRTVTFVLLVLVVIAVSIWAIRYIATAMTPVFNFVSSIIHGARVPALSIVQILEVILAIIVLFVAARTGRALSRLDDNLKIALDGGKVVQTDTAARLDQLEQRIQALEKAPSDVSKPLIPLQRPKIIPVKFDRGPDGNFGLWVRNDGEPAFDVSIEEPVKIGPQTLTFWNRTHPGLTKDQAELFINSAIRQDDGRSLSGASSLRKMMIQARVESVTLRILYRDLEDHHWATSFNIVAEFWGHGLRIGSVKQDIVTPAAG